MAKCPCGSENPYEECCEPCISGEAESPTAEALMRARYSAYAIGATGFIDETVHPDKRDSSDEDVLPDEDIKWTGLTIVATKDGQVMDDTGEVEFIANFEVGGNQSSLHERSRFQKLDGRWYYIDGDMVESSSRQARTNKIGRNEPCLCGSGLKYKKCCGK